MIVMITAMTPSEKASSREESRSRGIGFPQSIPALVRRGAILREKSFHLAVDAVRPPEAHDVGLVAGGDIHVGRAGVHVVLLADGAVVLESVLHGRHELSRNAVGIRGVAIP